MKLIGQAKESFEAWLKLQEFEDMNVIYNGKVFDVVYVNMKSIKRFDKLPLSMQWGVMQDFADSVGYYMEIETYIIDGSSDARYYRVCIYGKVYEDFGQFNTRQEARTAAVEKFNELYNNRSVT